MSIWLIQLIVFIAVTAGVIAVASALRRDEALERIERNKTQTAIGDTSVFFQERQSKLMTMLRPLQSQLTEGDAKQVGVVKSELVQAGIYQPTAMSVFFTVRLALALALGVAGWLLILFVLPPSSTAMTLLIIFGGVAFGYYLPVALLKRRIAARQQAFRHGIPDAMDMILVGVEAGLSLPAAINHLCDELADAHPIIAEQFRIVSLEFQAGKSRSDALMSLARRMDVEEARTLATMISQAETLGTSLATTLRVLADEMRRDRMLKAEEKASELPVKIAVPLVVCIFPALLSVIMTPLIIRITTALKSVT